jgi:hypothetical protein
MKIKLSLTLLWLLAFASIAVAQSVVITPKKVTYKRTKPITDFKKTFTVNYPKVKAANAALSRKIESVISFEKNFNFSLKEEMGEIQWLEEGDYEVLYNKNGILSINLFITGSGAYPDSSNKTIVVDLKTGNKVLPVNVFTDISGLIGKIKQIQKENIKKGIEEIKTDPDFQSGQAEIEARLKRADFKPGDLEGFSISGEGVTFTYDYSFPHVIQALEPNGSYFMRWAEIKPFIKPAGLLGRFIR